MSHDVREQRGRPFGYPRSLSFTHSHDLCKGNACMYEHTVRYVRNGLVFAGDNKEVDAPPSHIEYLVVDLKAVCTICTSSAGVAFVYIWTLLDHRLILYGIISYNN